jgi:hypothetical protein
MANENKHAETPKKENVEGIPGFRQTNCEIIPSVANGGCASIIKVRGRGICCGCYWEGKISQ